MSLMAIMYLAAPAYPQMALAYIGPGLGLATMGLILGLIFSVFLAVAGLFWYPLKRLFGKRLKTRRGSSTPAGYGQDARDDGPTD